ncbi:unnamed protein product [Natator depressus]
MLRKFLMLIKLGSFGGKMLSRTYIPKEEKSMPGYKTAKDRLTLLLSANSAGDFKLKPLQLVYHLENHRVLKGYSKAFLPVIWKSNPKTWVSKNIFEDWFNPHFVPSVRGYCNKNSLAFKALLILDNASGHPTILDDMHPDMKVVFLPPNTTSLLQSITQGIIASFKAYYLSSTFTRPSGQLRRKVDQFGRNSGRALIFTMQLRTAERHGVKLNNQI